VLTTFATIGTVAARAGSAVAGVAGARVASAFTISLGAARCCVATVNVWSASGPPESDGRTTSTTISSATMR